MAELASTEDKEDRGENQKVGAGFPSTKPALNEKDQKHSEAKSVRHKTGGVSRHSLDSERSISGSEVTVVSHHSYDFEEFSGSDDSDCSREPGPPVVISTSAAQSPRTATKEESTRTKKRRKRMRLLISHTMGMEPSKSLMLIIENTEQKLENHYDMGPVLGEGSFGVVRRGNLKINGAARAVKSISKDLMKRKYHLLKQEINIMKSLDHPNLLMLLEIFEDRKSLHLVLEFCAGGSLGRYLEKNHKLNEVQSAVVMQQVLRAALYLHKHTICHRDFKADNCLLAEAGPLEETSVKVCDFGISCCLAKGKFLTGLCGTPTHMAPEVVNKKYKHSCDIWSCGVMAYNLLCNEVPFQGSSNEEIFEAIKREHIQDVFCASKWVDISEEAIEFVFSLMTKNPRKRPSAQEALSNVWIQKRVAQAGNLEVPSTLISNLRKFREGNKFKRAILQTIAGMLPGSDTAFARKAFILLDADGDGVFSVVELAEALKKGLLKQSIEIDKDIEVLDCTFSSGDQKAFTYHEFVAAIFDKQKAHKQGLFQATFMALDKNDDHSLQISELATGHLLGKLSTDEIHSVLAETLESHDHDQDGTISYEEYLSMFSNFNHLVAR